MILSHIVVGQAENAARRRIRDPLSEQLLRIEIRVAVVADRQRRVHTGIIISHAPDAFACPLLLIATGPLIAAFPGTGDDLGIADAAGIGIGDRLLQPMAGEFILHTPDLGDVEIMSHVLGAMDMMQGVVSQLEAGGLELSDLLPGHEDILVFKGRPVRRLLQLGDEKRGPEPQFPEDGHGDGALGLVGVVKAQDTELFGDLPLHGVLRPAQLRQLIGGKSEGRPEQFPVHRLSGHQGPKQIGSGLLRHKHLRLLAVRRTHEGVEIQPEGAGTGLHAAHPAPVAEHVQDHGTLLVIAAEKIRHLFFRHEKETDCKSGDFLRSCRSFIFRPLYRCNSRPCCIYRLYW